VNRLSNSFEDFLDGQLDALNGFKQHTRTDELTHQVFTTDAGRELLSVWVDQMAMTSSVRPESTAYECGLIEGEKNFVRRLLLSMHKAEQVDEKPSIFKFIKTKLLQVTK